MWHVLPTDSAENSSVKALCSFRTADSSIPVLSDTAPILWIFQKHFCHFRTMDSSFHSQRQESQLIETLAVRVTPHKTCIKLPGNSVCLYFYSVCAPAYTWPVKETDSLFFLSFFFFFGSWDYKMLRPLEMYAIMERAGETASVSLSTSLQPSFMPLSLAQRLTLSTPLSLLTLLHTEPCFRPQQYIDMPLRQLINSSGCVNGLHARGESVHRH